ncbi:hypothetical protein [Herminiimonas contaminans]|uniref:Resolvase-like protein n=1 Tax=Herminiimonas contaminans TaxID=1111140 RepID=A0ABS0ESP4_9BURK|nr:hypothetical protein [Herminiimonas contaminans]MBF8177821.1 hypothetical protein [Herminiimonas contaminans]
MSEREPYPPVCLGIRVDDCKHDELNIMSMLSQVMEYATRSQHCDERISPAGQKRIAVWFADRYGSAE